PVLIIRGDDYENGAFSSRAVHIMDILSRIRTQAVWRELGSAELRADGRIDVLLSGRPTVFTLDPEKEMFARLEAVAAQLDRAGRYPRSVTIRNESAILKGI
ncbi:MAG: hypothetical protein ACRCUT_05225, partial [Spirochaetota bacterium]